MDNNKPTTKFNVTDAAHISFPVANRETDFEWWYVDAALNNGDYFVSMISLNDTRLNPRCPSVRANIYEANGNEIREIEIFEEDQVFTSYEKCDTRMGNHFIVDHGDYFELYAKINGNGAHLKLYPLHPSWTTPPMDNLMGWTVAIPYAKVTGVIFKNNVEIPVTGTGYHDHNWGTKPMGAQIRNWYWGKVHTEDISIDYGVLIPKDSPNPVVSVLITDQDNVLIDPIEVSTKKVKAEVELDQYKHELVLDKTFANQLKFNIEKDDLKISLMINVDHLVMIDKAQFKSCESAYRYIGNEKMTVTRKGITKTYTPHSLHEIVYLP